MGINDGSAPSRALLIPLADIDAVRDQRRKLKVVGTVTRLDAAAARCVISDLSSAAVFDPSTGFEVSAQAARPQQPVPELALDLALLVAARGSGGGGAGDDESSGSAAAEPYAAPALGDKLLATGYLDWGDERTEALAASLVDAPPTSADQGQAHPQLTTAACVLRVQLLRSDDRLDVAAWNRAARMASHYVHSVRPGRDEVAERAAAFYRGTS